MLYSTRASIALFLLNGKPQFVPVGQYIIISMDTITPEDFQNLLQGDLGKYYIGRWEYYKVVIDLVNRLQPAAVLELGPGQHTIVKHCDIMVKPDNDSWGRPINAVGQVYLHDATEKPWPVADKQYDLFIALQVWEHLSNKQSRAFREVMRVSKAGYKNAKR